MLDHKVCIVSSFLSWNGYLSIHNNYSEEFDVMESVTNLLVTALLESITHTHSTALTQGGTILASILRG